MPVYRDNQGHWLFNESNQVTSRTITPNEEMLAKKKTWAEKRK
jgi:hypothetical protein